MMVVTNRGLRKPLEDLKPHKRAATKKTKMLIAKRYFMAFLP